LDLASPLVFRFCVVLSRSITQFCSILSPQKSSLDYRVRARKNTTAEYFEEPSDEKCDIVDAVGSGLAFLVAPLLEMSDDSDHSVRLVPKRSVG